MKTLKKVMFNEFYKVPVKFYTRLKVTPQVTQNVSNTRIILVCGDKNPYYGTAAN
jgi:hypothetical protein